MSTAIPVPSHEPPPIRVVRPRRPIPTLESGMRMNSADFLRAYKNSPWIKKAELINGMVFIMSPFVGAQFHAEPDGILQGWCFNYSISTEGTKNATNATVELTPDDTAQPDGLIRILPECGGLCHYGVKRVLEGPPEFVFEVAASSKAIDLREKKEMYRRCGVLEYLIWRTEDAVLNWWCLENGEYCSLPVGADRIYKSRVLPGLWLDEKALLAEDGARVLGVLQRGLKSAAHAAFSKQNKSKRSTPKK